MKIFVLLSRFPYPLEKGDKLRAYHQIRILSRKHEIFLCAFHEGKFDNAILEPIKPFCKSIKVIRLSKLHIFLNLFRTVFTDMPFQAGYFYSSKAHSTIQFMIGKHKPDVIFCQLIRMAEYVRNDDTKIKVLDYMDAFSKGIERRIALVPFYLKPFFQMEWKRLKRYEQETGKYFSSRLVISEQDRNYLSTPEMQTIQVVPNGVDVQYFTRINKKPTYDFLFTGNLSYPPNVECAVFLAKKLIPALKKEFPGIKLLIAGASPSGSVKKLRSENIVVKGWTNDIREYYSDARIFIAPIFIGTGMQNKILEAMSMKLPCITSVLVNNAIGAENGKEILVSDDSNELLGYMKKLMNDESLVNTIGSKGQQFVSRKYSWESSVRILESNFR